MNDKINNIICTALATVAVCGTLFGCADKQEVSSPPAEIVSPDAVRLTGETPDLIPYDQKYTKFVLSNRGETEYTVVLPQNALDLCVFASVELGDRFNEATGGSLSTVRDSAVSSADGGKYIFLDRTTFSGDLDVSEDVLGVNGYVLKTVGDDVYICGATERGTLNGVYEFLKCTVNYKFYAPELWQINDNTENILYMPDFDMTVVPAVDVPYIRTESLVNPVATGRRYRVMDTNDIFINIYGAGYHVATSYVRPTEYEKTHPEYFATESDEATTNNILRDVNGRVSQLCYNAHGDEEALQAMLDIEMKELKDSILREQTDPHQLMYAWYTQMDNYDWCGCDACKADAEKYGSPAGSIIKHVNLLSAKLKEWIEEEGIGRRVNLVIYAYMNTSNAPTYFDDEIKLADNIALFYAPIRSNFVEDYYDEINETYYENLKNWTKAINGGGLMLWAYNLSYFGDYIAPHYGFDAFQQNVEIMAKEFDMNVFLASGDYENRTRPDFGMLKYWLNAELMWDYTQDVSQLLDNYFNVCYREAADPMRKYFDRYCDWFNYTKEINNYNGSWTNATRETLTAEFYPLRELQAWLEYTDEAYAAVERYKEDDPVLYSGICDRILQETITPRYLITEIHKGSFDGKVFDEMLRTLDEDMLSLGIISRGEGGGRWY